MIFGAAMMAGVMVFGSLGVSGTSFAQDKEMDAWVAGQYIPQSIPGKIVGEKKTTVKGQDVWEFTVKSNKGTTIVDINSHNGSVVRTVKQNGQASQSSSNSSQSSNSKASQSHKNNSQADNSSVNSNSSSSNQQGGKLAETGTNYPTGMLFGLITVAFGSLLLLLRRKFAIK